MLQQKPISIVGNPGGTIALILEAIVIGIAHEQILGRKNLLILLLGDGINDPHIRRTESGNTVTVKSGQSLNRNLTKAAGVIRKLLKILFSSGSFQLF